MEPVLADLETSRNTLYQKLLSIGDFRPGIISVNYRKCGKERCACAQKNHPGHGPQYLWNTTLKGKSLSQNLRPGPELDKARREIATYKQFEDWHKEVIALNQEICRLKPAGNQSEKDKDDAVKKKLQKKSSLKRTKK